MDKKINILFTGLIRAPELLKKSIRDLVILRKEGLVNQITFSTWKGELGKNPHIQEFFIKNKINFIESNEPQKDDGEHNLHQMLSMDIGMRHIEKNSFVLKTRADLCINIKFLRKLFKEKEKLLKITKKLPKGNIFRYKVWIPNYNLETPFYMSDICFFGHYDDLKLLFNYDFAYDFDCKIRTGRVHVRRFAYPFRKDYPIIYRTIKEYNKKSIFRSILKKFSNRIFNLRRFKFIRKASIDNQYQIFRKQLKDPLFIKGLAAYYFILSSHFYVDGNSIKNLVIHRGYFNHKWLKIDSKDILANFTKKSLFYNFRHAQIFVYDQELLNNIMKKKIKKDKFSTQLLKAIDEFSDQ